MRKSLMPIIFWALIGVFLFTASQLFIPIVRELARGPVIFLLPFFVFFLLGIILIFLALKEKVEKSLKRFLILTGGSATGFFLFVLLHNLFYGLEIVISQISVLSLIMEILYTVSFIIAIFVCPLGFVIGAIGTIMMFIKKKENIVL
ncbi:MAG TPA: hypothetical protein VFD40_00410 [Candidatus Paceibacterota bacterium]|nr:hypothetical protein [Candidatus Paceibacterota bacterium]